MITAIDEFREIFTDYDTADYYEMSTALCLIGSACSNKNKREIVVMFDCGFYWEMCEKMLIGYFNEMNQIIVDHIIYPIEDR